MSRSFGVSPDSPPSFTASLLTEPGLSPPAYTVSAWKGRTGCLSHPPHPSPTQCKLQRNSLTAWMHEQVWSLEAHVSSPSELAFRGPEREVTGIQDYFIYSRVLATKGRIITSIQDVPRGKKTPGSYPADALSLLCVPSWL